MGGVWVCSLGVCVRCGSCNEQIKFKAEGLQTDSGAENSNKLEPHSAASLTYSVITNMDYRLRYNLNECVSGRVLGEEVEEH